MMVRLWPDLVAYIILGAAAFWLLSLLYASMIFTGWGEKVIGVLVWGAPVALVVWAVWVVVT